MKTYFDHHVLGRNAGRKAFTLIEIMVAIMLFSLVIAAIYSSWSSIIRGTRTGMDAAADAQRMRVTLRVLEDSLASAQLYAANYGYYAFEADTSGDFASFSFVSRLSQSFPLSGQMEQYPVRRLTFQVESGRDGDRQLVMRQSPLLLDREATEGYSEIVLAKPVNLFLAEFWDEQEGEWVEEWLLTNQLPAVVRIFLDVGPTEHRSRNPMERAVARVIHIPSMEISPEVQLPGLNQGQLRSNGSVTNDLNQPGNPNVNPGLDAGDMRMLNPSLPRGGDPMQNRGLRGRP